MPRAKANGIEIEYDTFGSPSSQPMLLIMGFRTQMIGWEEGFCDELASRGFFVIRFDNRDVGLSTKIEGRPDPDVPALFRGDPSSAVYALEDMAKDACGLLDALGIDAAHIVGASMGGMIAQLIAIHHAKRVRSLASLLSTTGDRSVGQPSAQALAAIGGPAPTAREPFIDYCVAGWNVLGSPAFPVEEAELRRRAARGFDRCFYPAGVVRQLAAVLVAADRTSKLALVEAPTVVVHGSDDPLVAVSGAEATARAIPGSRLLVIPGLGHDIPKAAWPIVIDALADNAARAAEEPLN